MNEETIVKVENVSFRYNGQSVLDEIDLDIKRGEFLGLIGPNGSGKTTLLKILLGLLKPSTGSVALFGKNISAFDDWSKIGYVPQKVSALASRFPITVKEIVAMGLVNNRRWLDFFTSKDDLAVGQALKEVDMQEFSHSLINELSGGQQQRVFIARALVSSPELLILDEPTVGVDTESQTKFYQLLRKLNKERKLTLILVSHDVDVIAHEVGRIICLNCRLVGHGKPKEVLDSDFVEKLYGKNLRFIVHGH